MKVLMSYTHYPLSVAKFFRDGFRTLGHEVFTVGPCSYGVIPWQPDTDFSEHQDVPGAELFPQEYGELYSYPVQEAVGKAPWQPDLVVEIDAGFHLKGGYHFSPLVLVGTDPHCVAGDTLVATGQGILSVQEAVGFPVTVHDKTGEVGCKGIIQNGHKPTRRIELETGQQLTCTDDHLLETPKGFVRADAVKLGDKLILACGTYSPPKGTAQDYAIGFVLGAFQGDGSFGKEGFVRFTLHKYKKTSVADAIKSGLRQGFGIDHVTEYNHRESENSVVLQARRWGLYRFLKQCDLKNGHMPLYIRRGTKNMIAGYLAGLFATDGCSFKGRLQFSTKWSSLAHELQTVLFYLGVPTSLSKQTNKKGSYKPGATLWTLFVRTGAGTEKFSDLVGEIPDKEYRRTTRRRGVSNGIIQKFKVVKVEGAVKNMPEKRVLEPVYDVLDTANGTFLASGFSVHNCLDYHEQSQYVNNFYVMQHCHIEDYTSAAGKIGGGPVPQWLPYCYDPAIHYWEPKEKVYDVCFIGVLYPERKTLVARLQQAGFKVFSAQGILFEEGTSYYNQSHISLNLSSRQDLPMRFWEGMAYRNCVVTNRVPDLEQLAEWGCVEGREYLAYSDPAECVEVIKSILAWPERMWEIATAGWVWVQRHTYARRAAAILEGTLGEAGWL